LGGLLALGTVAAGCTGRAEEQPAPRTSPSPAPGINPDVALAATVLTAEQEALDLVKATMRRHRSLRPVLLATAQGHEKHAALLRDAVPSDAPSPSASGSASAPPTSASAPPTSASAPSGSPGAPSGTPSAEPQVPSDPAKALAAVARAEDRLTLLDRRSAFSAESGAFARILGSMAAAAAQQAVLLREAPGAGR
jgi:hypothetical protein